MPLNFPFFPAIENEVIISASEMNATAGQPYTLLCTVSSERLSNLSWVDPNGVACPLDNPDTTVSYSGWIGGLSTLELTFHSIRTSQSGVYKCISNIAIPPSKGEASFLVQVKSKLVEFLNILICYCCMFV